MRAMVMHAVKSALVIEERPDPTPGPGEARIRVRACAVCRTDLHVVDGDLAPIASPLVPGHEIVGTVDQIGAGVAHVRVGERVGVGWLGKTCGCCSYCAAERENLCDAPTFTGYTRDGGFAEYAVADARFVYRLPETGEEAELAPLMCAGLIGWRSLVFAGEGRALGFYGFGAAAHIMLQVAKWQGRRVHVFTKPGDNESQAFARSLGADWAGDVGDAPSEMLDAAIIYAPVGDLVPAALRVVKKGGRVVCAGIHMSDIPAFPYHILWGERSVMSVANLTRKDAEDFLALVPQIGIKTHINRYPLARANEALSDLRAGKFQGAAVLTP